MVFSNIDKLVTNKCFPLGFHGVWLNYKWPESSIKQHHITTTRYKKSWTQKWILICRKKNVQTFFTFYLVCILLCLKNYNNIRIPTNVGKIESGIKCVAWMPCVCVCVVVRYPNYIIYTYIYLYILYAHKHTYAYTPRGQMVTRRYGRDACPGFSLILSTLSNFFVSSPPGLFPRKPKRTDVPGIVSRSTNPWISGSMKY